MATSCPVQLAKRGNSNIDSILRRPFDRVLQHDHRSSDMGHTRDRCVVGSARRPEPGSASEGRSRRDGDVDPLRRCSGCATPAQERHRRVHAELATSRRLKRGGRRRTTTLEARVRGLLFYPATFAETGSARSRSTATAFAVKPGGYGIPAFPRSPPVPPSPTSPPTQTSFAPQASPR